MDIELVKRPTPYLFNLNDYNSIDPDLWSFVCNKGWQESVEHFAQAFLNGTKPLNADGTAGALSTNIALTLLKSLESGRAVDCEFSTTGQVRE
jgi:hypothetical protein